MAKHVLVFTCVGQGIKIFTVAAIIGIPKAALANAAMGLGLERWDLRYWYAYVGIVVFAEAWILGRWLKFSWKQSLARSVAANLLTGVVCGGIGLFAPFLHTPMAGSRMNPNPLADMILTIAAFSIPSAVVESAFWTKEGKVRLYKVCGAHLATIPLAVLILLIPEKPYPGLEALTRSARSMDGLNFGKDLETWIKTTERLPKSGSLPGLREEIGSRVELASLYDPSFGRFTTSEQYTKPLELNLDLLGKPIPATEKAEEWVWFIRYPDGKRGYGIEVNLADGSTRRKR